MFVPESGNILCGVISYLVKKHCGTVHESGIVDVTSSISNGRYQKNGADSGNCSLFFQSTNMNNSWLCCDFKSMEVISVHHAILSFPTCPSFHPPRNLLF